MKWICLIFGHQFHRVKFDAVSDLFCYRCSSAVVFGRVKHRALTELELAALAAIKEGQIDA